MLSSQAVLTGIGVGKEAATAYGAVFMFAVRDLTGMLGGLVFAHMQGSGFDSCAKQWRLFADIMNNVGMALDLASPLFPDLFLCLTCLGSISRAITWVAGSATRAALTQHFALNSNAADIAAKEQSQETAVTAIGMTLGILLTRMCAHNHIASWLCFLALTVLHVWANIKAMRSLILTTLNQPRLDVLLQSYAEKGTVLTPKQTSAAEDLTPLPLKALWSRISASVLFYDHKIGGAQLGVSLSKLVDIGPTAAGQKKKSVHQDQGLAKLLKEQGDQSYLLGVTPWGSTSQQVVVVLHKSAGPQDLMRAYVHSWKVSHGRKGRGGKVDEAAAKQWMQVEFPAFLKKLKGAGWNVERVGLPTLGWTAEWKLPRHHRD
ncbi:hypothetical protein CEUSTIGMA_g6612.t1 [Chlamydomonas eustigma]|uniref:DUF647 domain-containing protein n=1 Tax=Chlamydomonas eustigma TaxID=1157962 RepID=A0A250X8F6_9CHLO|nr:hypothetical protein CEUSTIGMA_g6612.t1 [Chlamydomonas eustigma]|eukprot:GAX79172.1 hypothetical protein CEUSTIGMA_g6612.t1 [Chlamydomonas eustigma]